MNTLLLVDDDQDLGNLLRDFLTSGGFDVHLCLNGKQALTKIAQLRPMLALIDGKMPEMDGYQTVAAIRNIDLYASLPIILMSSEEPQWEEGGGWNSYLKKPLDLSALLNEIQCVLAYSNPKKGTAPKLGALGQ